MKNNALARFALAATALAALGACTTTPSYPIRSAVIERTTHGVAHITAPDHEMLGFGAGYAHAQDNVCQTAQQLVTVRGERALFFGPEGQGQLANRMLGNVQIDTFVRAHMDDAALARAAAAMSPDARAALRGYANGYNRFLTDRGLLNLPAECRGAAWVRPMGEADLARLGEQTMVLASSGAFADAIVAAAPPVRTGALSAPQPVAQAPEVSPQDAARVLAGYSFNDNPEHGEFGSNGWAFGRDATPDGSGVLLGNPHFPWIGTSRFWQMHLTIPGQLDVMGASIGASPFVQIGFNRDVAWTHTVSTGRRFTLYELQLDPADPTVYLVDGQKKRMDAVRVVVPVRGGGAPVERTLYRTQWGPLIVIPGAGLGWSATTAYAFADANTLNTRSTDAWMAMNRATSVQELRTAMGNQGIPWVNTIAADRNGSAMYADLSVVPDVSAAMLGRCAPSPRAAALMGAAGLPVLNGARADCAWNRDAAAGTPGITPAARMPVVITRDWVQNSNDSYWLSNPAVAPAPGISPLVGPVGTAQRLRTRSGVQEIRARLAGTDGLPGRRMGVDEVRTVILRNRNMAAQLVLPDLLATCESARAEMPDDLRDACNVLARWDRTNNVNAPGALLFKEFWRKGTTIAKVWRVPFDPAQPLTTPAGLNMADPAVNVAVWNALRDAAALLVYNGHPVDAWLGMVQGREVSGRRGPFGDNFSGGTRVEIPGGEEFEGVLNRIDPAPPYLLTADGYQVVYGSSYLQAVTFNERGPLAYGLLTYGQSSNPGSPYAYDQLAKFARGEWVPLPFTRQEIESQRVGKPLVLAY